MTIPNTKASNGPKVVLALTTLVAAGAVYWSHISQVEEKKTMRAGVERDKERMRMKRALMKQRELERQKQQEEGESRPTDQ